MTEAARRLLILVHGYPPAVGGVEFAVRDLAQALVRDHGYQVTVLTTTAYTNANFHDRRLPSMAPTTEVLDGVRVRRLPVLTFLSPMLRVAQKAAVTLRAPGNDWLRTWYQGPIAPALRAAVREEVARGVDVICAASFPLNHLFYAFVPQGPPVILLGSIHTEDAWGYERPNLLQLTTRASATVAHTEPERQWLIERGAPADRVVVIPEGIAEQGPPVEPGAFRREAGIPESAFVIAYVGQQGAHKGIDVLLRTFPELLRRIPEAWLVVAGARTPFTPALDRLLRELPEAARRRSRLLTDVDEKRKAAILRDSDVFCSPSRYESFGLTTLEAWRQRRAVVVGESAATRWVVGEAGMLVQYGDSPALVRAITRLESQPDLRRHLGKAGARRLSSAFTSEVVHARYADLFAALGNGAR